MQSDPQAITAAQLMLDESVRSMQAIAAEVSDYTQRLVQDSSMTLGDVTRSASMPDVIAQLTAFNKRSLEDYLQQMARLSTLYASLFDNQTRAAQALMLPQRG